MAEFDSVIPAGGSGKVTAKVRTSPTQKGKLTKSVNVTTDAPSASSLRLIVSFDVVPVIDVRPKNNLFLSGLVGETATAAALLHRADAKPLEVTAIEAEGSEGLVGIKTEPWGVGSPPVDGVEGAPGDIWVVATLAPQASEMTRALRVLLETNHPDMKQVELRVSVRVQSLIEPAPKTVRLLASDNPRHRRRVTLRLTHTRGTPFSVVSIKVADPQLFTASLLSEGKLKMHTLGVILAEDLDLEALEPVTTSSITVTTDDPALPVLEVPVRIDSIGAAKPGTGSAAASRPVPGQNGRVIRARPVMPGRTNFRNLGVPDPKAVATPAPAPAPAPSPAASPAATPVPAG